MAKEPRISRAETSGLTRGVAALHSAEQHGAGGARRGMGPGQPAHAAFCFPPIWSTQLLELNVSMLMFTLKMLLTNSDIKIVLS